MSLLIVPLLYPDLAGLLNFSDPFQNNFGVAESGATPYQLPDSGPPILATSPGRKDFRRSRQADMSGSRSSKRTDLPQKTISAILRPARFCWYSNPRSTVNNTSNLAASRFKKFAVLKSSEPGVACGLTFMAREVLSQLLVYTLVE